MRILVLGGSGRTGQLVIEEALRRRHTVTALVRSAASLAARDGLTLVAGTPLKQNDMDAALAATADTPSAVVVTLKARPASSDGPATLTLMADSVANAMAAMRRRGVRKLVVMQAQGTGKSLASVNLVFRAIFALSSMRAEFDDHNQVERRVREEDAAMGGGVDFVLLRPVMLTDGEAQPVKFFPEDGSGVGYFPRITRKSVATVLVEAAASDAYDGTTPVISN